MSERSLVDSQTEDNHETPDSPSEAPEARATSDNLDDSKGATRPAEDPGSDSRPADPFDPARLRLSQDFAAGLGVKRALLTVPVRKPAKEWWVQVHPDEAYRIQTAVLELKEDRETYLVDPDLWSELATESTFSPRALFSAMTRQGVVFLWPIRLPGPDGKLDEWSRSALEAATMAAGQWVRVEANMHLGAYEVSTATANLPDPEWPDVPFKQLLQVAFKDRYIDTLDHPVLQRLRGEK